MYSIIIAKMTQLMLGKNVEITSVVIPDSTAMIIFSGGFNQSIGPNVLPSFIKSMVFRSTNWTECFA